MAIYGSYPVLTHLIDYRRQTLIRWQSSNFNNALFYFLNAFLSSSYCASKHHFCFFFFFTSVFGIIVTFLFDLLAFPDATERWREVNKWVGLSHMYLDSSRYESLHHTEIFFKIWGIFSSLWTLGHPATHLCLLNTDLNLWTLTHFYSACAIHLHGMEIVIPTFPGIIFTVHVLLNQFRFFSKRDAQESWKPWQEECKHLKKWKKFHSSRKALFHISFSRENRDALKKYTLNSRRSLKLGNIIRSFIPLEIL